MFLRTITPFKNLKTIDALNSKFDPRHYPDNLEDISKFDLLDDAILSTPNVSATTETDPLVPTKKVVAAEVVPIVPTNIDVADEVDLVVPAQKTPAAKRTTRQKSYDDRVDICTTFINQNSQMH
ncbi:hypothetical protein QL285_008476 [Trifolium repens]|nr:hypothetical protein QL285_008476 [Trifolium repens]